MKKITLLALLGILVCGAAQAQATRSIIKTPDQNSIVKDASGMVYPYGVWVKMLNSGEYTLKSRRTNLTDSVIYEIVQRSPQEVEAYMSRLKKPTESDRFKVGDVFKPFKTSDIDGVKLDLKKTLAGKVIVLNFWFIGCPPCRAEIPDLNKVVEQYKDNKDVVFIAIALDLEDDIRTFVKIHPYNYHIIDNGRFLADQYGVHLYPTNVIINRDGKVAFSSVSSWPQNPYWMKKTIDEALRASVNTTAVR